MKTTFLVFLTMWFALSASQAQSPPPKQSLKIVALGDSLTAGYGLTPELGFVPQLQKALAINAPEATEIIIINAGVAGDTSSQGLDRLDWAVPEDTQGVLLELGANDALRGQDPAQTEKSLDLILARLQARKIPVFFIGMRAPPNLGDNYQTRFNDLYPRLANKYTVDFYPFFLEGVAGTASLNQQDGMHPNEAGVNEIVKRVSPLIQKWITHIVLKSDRL